MIRVLIVDDQALIREGLRMMLNLWSDIDLVGEVSNGEEAINILGNIEVDVVLMDIRMPVMNGVEATKAIKEKYPCVKILILTTFNEDEYIFEGLNNGADGYILKDISSAELVHHIRAIYEGQALIQPQVAKKIISAIRENNHTDICKLKSLAELTPREKEIAQLIGEGRSNKEISKQLYITEGTVKNHVTRILDKLEVRDRTQLAIRMKKSSCAEA